MTTHTNPRVYQDLLSWTQNLATTHPSTKPIDGTAYGQPGQTVFTQTVYKLSEGGQIEVNLTQPDADQAFEWRAEITVDDLSSGDYKHYLLRKLGDVVETYGKQVTPVSDNQASELLLRLKQLTGASA